jgi:protein YibB
MSELDKMNSITIVTAFFDIDRKNFIKLPRTTETYIRWFERWARIKNRLIVFCGSVFIKNEIIRIRTKYNLIDKTRVVIIDDVFSLESDIYQRMVSIAKDAYFLNFRVIKNATSNIPEYNYITCLKSYFLYKASTECNVNTDFVAWIDFGFDHGGTLYTHEDDWSFLWQCNCLQKIYLFYLPNRLEQRPVFEVIRTLQPDSIDGSSFLCPVSLTSKFWLLNKSSIYELLDLGLMDDDQTIFLLCSRREPSLFILQQSYWFLPIRTLGGEHMRINNDFLNPRSKWYSCFSVFFRKIQFFTKAIANEFYRIFCS